MTDPNEAERLRVRSMFREYEVAFSDDAVSVLAATLDPAKTFVVCDGTILELWGADLDPLLTAGRLSVIEPSEASKTMRRAEELISEMVTANVRRDHTVLAIGGGITQDVAAFAASVLYRGIEWSFLPTTLLAQADSCLGSKTSINVGEKKNLVGTFWPPSLAVIDPRFLTTLPDHAIKSGFGEILHFLLFANSPFARKLSAEHAELLRDRTGIGPYIRECLLIKKAVAERDELDKGERHKFNYGHTFGHALESATGYGITHGQAVTVGMDIANYLSYRSGLMPEAVFDDTHGILAFNMPPRKWDAADMDSYLSFLGRDKKNLENRLGCILAERPGALVAKQLPIDSSLRALLTDYFAGPWWRP